MRLRTGLRAKGPPWTVALMLSAVAWPAANRLLILVSVLSIVPLLVKMSTVVDFSPGRIIDRGTIQPSVEFVRVGAGYCRTAKGCSACWPRPDHTASCIPDRSMCEAKCSSDPSCKGMAYVDKDRMGHCFGGPNEWGFTLKQSEDSIMPGQSRCILYTSANPAMVVENTTVVPDEGDPQWVIESAREYTCYATRREFIARGIYDQLETNLKMTSADRR